MFESAPEIQMLKQANATVVGQSTGQEAIGARISRMCFAGVYPVVNFAEGLESGVWSPGGMGNIYREIGIPMAVVEYWALQALVRQERKCDCEKIANSAALERYRE